LISDEVQSPFNPTVEDFPFRSSPFPIFPIAVFDIALPRSMINQKDMNQCRKPNTTTGKSHPAPHALDVRRLDVHFFLVLFGAVWCSLVLFRPNFYFVL